MFTGLKVKKNSGFTNLTGVHPYLSKIAIDSGAIDKVFDAYGFPDRPIKNRHPNIGYTVVDIPYEKEIYGKTIQIETVRDILYISDIADMYDNPNDVIRRRIYHSNIQPIYHGFVNGFGNLMSLWPLSDHTFEAYVALMAYTNHYFQDAFAPMHISLKDQDVHIPFEHAFDHYLYDHADELESKVQNMLKNRSVIDLSKYRGITDFAMKFTRNYMDVRDSMVQKYREGDKSFTGIEYFVYGAVIATIGNSANLITKDYMWRRLK